jgi:two-component system, cell cycle response regulator DivK
MAGEQILVIEDNAMNMSLAEALLRTAGYVPLPARNAEEGIALARAAQPAVILMDVSLPDMDGLTATAWLRRDAQTREIPIIAVTAHAMHGDEARILAAGCDGYVSKPVDRHLLLKAVAAAIESRGKRVE